MIDTVVDVIRYMAAATATDDVEVMAGARKGIATLYKNGDSDVGEPLWRMWVFLQRNLRMEGDADAAL